MSPRRGDHPVTLRTVAERAGVSKSSVSRVLQGSSRVSPEARAAVEAAIAELGYRPNAAAQSLGASRTRTIGVLVNDLRQPWFVDFLEGLGEGLAEHDLHAFVADGRLDRELDDRLLNAFVDMRVDGLVLAGTMPITDAIREAAQRLPTVIAGMRDLTLPTVDVVAEDDAEGARLAVEHLVGLGHERIAHIAGPDAEVFRQRRAGYEAAMRAAGLAEHIRVVTSDITEDDGFACGTRLFGRCGPTAVFTVNDLVCVGAMAAARDAGLSVPGEVSFVGFDDSSIARMRWVGLTSVDIQPRTVGSVAADLIVERIAEPERPAREHLVAPVLRERTSTGPAPV
ncbi:LacI family DNA-binding transcriptional regulator [Janibacter anophelis]|uniref:LacI family DNA-binding transcriptional regulator n=1 Tax=Janibacter anophelis TaxID=319054 RepID=UPI00083005E9|nr:LacI family DNA-binding transcriptional regulator [Janibacter anophelis]